jgi:hypothetical protein
MSFRLDPAWLAPQTLETACALVQQRPGSGSYFAGRLNQKRESGVHHFHELYRQALRKPAPRT